jgi:hypothetical protein
VTSVHQRHRVTDPVQSACAAFYRMHRKKAYKTLE